MKRVRDEAIILSAMDYLEADRLVTLFCREHGKLSAVVRGARKSRKRFAGAIELFARLAVSVSLKEGLSTLGECDIVTVYPGIRADLDRIAMAAYGAELTMALLPEHLPNPRLYRLLTAYLEYLEAGETRLSDRHFFEINLLNILGYRPPVESCQGCGALLAETGAVWGGEWLLCCGCAKGVKGEQLSAVGINLMLSALKTGRFGSVSFDRDAGREAGRFLDRFIARHLQKPLKSLGFMRLSP